MSTWLSVEELVFNLQLGPLFVGLKHLFCCFSTVHHHSRFEIKVQTLSFLIQGGLLSGRELKPFLSTVPHL